MQTRANRRPKPDPGESEGIGSCEQRPGGIW